MNAISLDAYALIYLGKIGLLEHILKAVPDITIDHEVYEEVVIRGKSEGYPDAQGIEATLKKHNVPVIMVDIQKELPFFRDRGETSTFLLSKENRIAVTSDRRAFAKFEIKGAKTLRTDILLLELLTKGKISFKIAKDGLIAMLKVGGTTPERVLVISKAMDEVIEVDK